MQRVERKLSWRNGLAACRCHHSAEEMKVVQHLWRVKENLSKIEWNILLSPIGPYDAKHSANKMVSAGGQGYQWMLVNEQLSEPVLPVNWRAHKWRAMRGLA